MHDNERSLQRDVTAAVTALRANLETNALEFAKLIEHPAGSTESQIVVRVLAEHGVAPTEIGIWNLAYRKSRGNTLATAEAAPTSGNQLAY